MRETFEPVLLERKALQMRKTTGNDQLQARTYNKDLTPVVGKGGWSGDIAEAP